MNAIPSLNADAIIQLLSMKPHPEGGHFVETYRAPSAPDERSAVTMIYFLLRYGEVSHWHRVDAVEIWNWYAGAALVLSIAEHDGELQTMTLGNDLTSGERPQGVVPAHAWQSARSLGDWTLVGCSVSPGFDFAGFELAPPSWTPVRG